jgi:hypothetical protein
MHDRWHLADGVHLAEEAALFIARIGGFRPRQRRTAPPIGTA